MVSMEAGIRHEHHMAARLDLLGRNINSIVGNLWQRQEQEGSGSSNGNISPGSGVSGPESPGCDRANGQDGHADETNPQNNPHGSSRVENQHNGGVDAEAINNNEDSGEDNDRSISTPPAQAHPLMPPSSTMPSATPTSSQQPSIGIRSDLLPAFTAKDLSGLMGADLSGLPALEALRRQAGHPNPFLGPLGPLTSLQQQHHQPLKRPSQPPTPQSSSSGGDPSASWSFEEQFKQLYEIDENPKRKEFLDDLFSFMQKRGTPINRLPIMAKQVLDLYELFNLVVARGGLVEVINKKQWQEIIKGLGLPSSITSAAFTLRTQYTKYLYPLEMNQYNFSNGVDLQSAIDGNKREGRRLGPYDGSPNPTSPHHMFNPAALQQHHSRLALSPPHPLHHSSGSSPPPHSAASSFHHQAAVAAAAAAAASSGDQLAQLEMTRLALWKLYSSSQQGVGLPPPPHGPHMPAASHPGLLPPLPPLHHHSAAAASAELDLKRQQMASVNRANEVAGDQPQRRHSGMEDSASEDDEAKRRADHEEARRRLVIAENDVTIDDDDDDDVTPPTKRPRNETEASADEAMDQQTAEEPSAEVSEAEPKRKEATKGETRISLHQGTDEAEKSMKITMEVNGIQYSGVLYAQTN